MTWHLICKLECRYMACSPSTPVARSIASFTGVMKILPILELVGVARSLGFGGTYIILKVIDVLIGIRLRTKRERSTVVLLVVVSMSLLCPNRIYLIYVLTGLTIFIRIINSYLNRIAIAELFKETNAIEIIKFKEIYETLEGSLDRSRDVADVIEDIALKYR